MSIAVSRRAFVHVNALLALVTVAFVSSVTALIHGIRLARLSQPSTGILIIAMAVSALVASTAAIIFFFLLDTPPASCLVQRALFLPSMALSGLFIQLLLLQRCSRSTWTAAAMGIAWITKITAWIYLAVTTTLFHTPIHPTRPLGICVTLALPRVFVYILALDEFIHLALFLLLLRDALLHWRPLISQHQLHQAKINLARKKYTYTAPAQPLLHRVSQYLPLPLYVVLFHDTASLYLLAVPLASLLLLPLSLLPLLESSQLSSLPGITGWVLGLRWVVRAFV